MKTLKYLIGVPLLTIFYVIIMMTLSGVWVSLATMNIDYMHILIFFWTKTESHPLAFVRGFTWVCSFVMAIYSIRRY